MVDVQNIRNVALVSQSGTGKSTLLAELLNASGVAKRGPDKTQAHMISDYTAEEKEKQFTLNSKIFTFPYKKLQFNILDTPGYPDFIGEVVSCLTAVESAILVVDTSGDIETQTEKIWALIKERNLPCLAFVNKMEQGETSFSEVLEELNRKLGHKFIPVQIPQLEGKELKGVADLLQEETSAGEDSSKWRESLLEVAAETDDSLIEKYLEEGGLSPEEVQKGLKKAIQENKFSPVLCGSALEGIGVDALLEFMINYLPHPGEGRVKDKEGKEIMLSEEGEPLAQVFKIISEERAGALFFFKVISGKLASSSSIYNSTQKAEEKLGQILVFQGKGKKEQAQVTAGQIAGIAKLKSTKISDTLGSAKNPVQLEEIKFPQPSTSFAICPKDRKDEEKIGFALERLLVEDPTLKVTRNKEFSQTIISGMGDVHLDMVTKRLKERFGVSVSFEKPKIPYRETIQSQAQTQYRHKKQTGGRGQFADVWIKVEPLPRGEGLQFADEIVGGRIPSRFIPSVEKGVKDAVSKGVAVGYQVTDLKVTLFDGSFHQVDSSDIAFQIAGSMAFKRAVSDANPLLLEPILEVEIEVPGEYVGDITGDLNSRRGKILNIETKDSLRTIKAQVPQSEMYKYATDLKSMTQGKGTYSQEFSHYEEVPAHVAKNIIEESKQ